LSAPEPRGLIRESAESTGTPTDLCTIREPEPLGEELAVPRLGTGWARPGQALLQGAIVMCSQGKTAMFTAMTIGQVPGSNAAMITGSSPRATSIRSLLLDRCRTEIRGSSALEISDQARSEVAAADLAAVDLAAVADLAEADLAAEAADDERLSARTLLLISRRPVEFHKTGPAVE
jgi:hypothetical protein